MRFGTKCESGSLPVFSVADEEEAESLLVLACPRNINGEFVAHPELTEEQTVENLAKFSSRLGDMHELLVQKGRCRCAS